MPILKKDVDLLPADLFDTEFQHDAQHRWWVLHSRPRAEKTIARRLARDGTSFFLPLFERESRRGRRRTTSHLPLFPGYVFLRADEDERLATMMTNQVANCLAVPDQDRLHADLQRVYRLIQSRQSLAPEARLEPGMSAEIVCGPLKGHRGTVLRKGKRLRFVIEVDFLQRGASVEVESTDIRPL